MQKDCRVLLTRHCIAVARNTKHLSLLKASLCFLFTCEWVCVPENQIWRSLIRDEKAGRLMQCCPTQLSILCKPNLRTEWRCGAGLYRTGKTLISVRDAKSAAWLYDPYWHRPWEQFCFLPAGHFHKCQVLGNAMYGISSKLLSDLICTATQLFFTLNAFSFSQIF